MYLVLTLISPWAIFLTHVRLTKKKQNWTFDKYLFEVVLKMSQIRGPVSCGIRNSEKSPVRQENETCIQKLHFGCIQ